MMPFGSLVNVANVFSHFSVFGFLHSAQTPANPKNSRSRTLISYFDFGPFLEAFHSKNDEAGNYTSVRCKLILPEVRRCDPFRSHIEQKFFWQLEPPPHESERTFAFLVHPDDGLD